LDKSGKSRIDLTGPLGGGRLMAGCFLAGLAGGVGAAAAEFAPGPWKFWIALLALALTMTAAIVLMIKWWGQIDEAAREAHKWAWWCGGNAGLAFGVVVVMALIYQGESIGFFSLSSMDALTYGAGALAVFPVAGYSIAWIWWWWRRR
jgi:hypothetical protein